MHDVCATDDIAPGSMRLVQVGSTPVLLLRGTNGEFRALRNSCAHMGAALSEGRFQTKMDSDGNGSYQVSDRDEVIRCPWHGYEFDIDSGQCAGDGRVRVKAYQVTTEGGRVLIGR
ncbi:hypothetical protein BAY59_27455 [Prauserella coralliicola]|nr:hypothetical protein BAY59_27455 [Prauserella coralliicola]